MSRWPPGWWAATLARMTSSAVVLRTCADLLSSVPYLLGFHPTDSVVVVALRGGRVRFAARGDLPGAAPGGPPLGAVAARFVALLARERADAVALIGYGAPSSVTPVLDALRSALAGTRLTVLDVVRVEGARYWSYLCTDPTCCPPSGVPFDAAAPAAVAAVVAGRVALPDRSTLVRAIAPVDGPARRSMRAATERAWRRLDDLLATRSGRVSFAALGPATGPATDHRDAGVAPAAVGGGVGSGSVCVSGGAGSPAPVPVREIVGRDAARPSAGRPENPAMSVRQRRLLFAAGRVALAEARDHHRAGRAPTDDEVAWLSVLLTHVPVRDHAWEHIDDDERHVAFWSDVVRRVEPVLAAAPAGLLAFAAWRAGHGALAAAAVDRALAADPRYPMALLMEEVLDQCVAPSSWQRRPRRNRRDRRGRRGRR